MNDRTYSSTDACAIAGVTYRRLDYWRRQGLFLDAPAEGPGSGGKIRWTVRDVERARIFALLIAAGFDANGVRIAFDLDDVTGLLDRAEDAIEAARLWQGESRRQGRGVGSKV